VVYSRQFPAQHALANHTASPGFTVRFVGPQARFLELRPLRFVGRISYSLYLWHVMTYHFWNAFVASPPHSSFSVRHTTAFQLLQYAAKYGIALATATLSYYFIEKPFVRMGHKLAPSATPGRPELADLPVEPLDSNILTTRSIHA